MRATNSGLASNPFATVAEVIDERGGYATLADNIEGSAREAAYGPAKQQAAYVYDDFDRADGLLSGMITPTGEIWGTTGTGAATVAIVDRQVTCATNVYSVLDYGSAINRISGTFSLSLGGGTNNREQNVLALIADQASAGLQDMLHLLISPTTWSLQKFVSGVATVIVSGSHELISGISYNPTY